MPTTTEYRKATAGVEKRLASYSTPQQARFYESNIASSSTVQLHPLGESKTLTLAVILEILQGTHPSSLIDDIISTAQLNLTQLKRTREHFLNTPISPIDGDRIIKAFRPKLPTTVPEMLTNIKTAHNVGFKTAQKAAKEIYTDVMKEEIKKAVKQAYQAGMQTGQEVVRQQYLNGMAHFENVDDPGSTASVEKLKNAQELSEKVHAETAAQLWQVSTELERSHLQAEESAAKLRAKSAQVERCKDMFRLMIQARDAGDKHRLEALVAEADLAEWLDLDEIGEGFA